MHDKFIHKSGDHMTLLQAFNWFVASDQSQVVRRKPREFERGAGGVPRTRAARGHHEARASPDWLRGRCASGGARAPSGLLPKGRAHHVARRLPGRESQRTRWQHLWTTVETPAADAPRLRV